MTELGPWALTVGALAAVLTALSRLAARARRRGAGRDMMGPFDMIWRPHTYQVEQQSKAQEQSGITRPSPDARLQPGEARPVGGCR